MRKCKDMTGYALATSDDGYARRRAITERDSRRPCADLLRFPGIDLQFDNLPSLPPLPPLPKALKLRMDAEQFRNIAFVRDSAKPSGSRCSGRRAACVPVVPLKIDRGAGQGLTCSPITSYGTGLVAMNQIPCT